MSVNVAKSNMGRWQFLPHVADIKIRVEGSSVADLLLSAMLALAKILQPGNCSDQGKLTVKKIIKIKTTDKTSLLIEFLNQVLFYSQVEGAIFCRLAIDKISDNSLTATISGYKVEGFAVDIKAVTYHQAEVIQDKKGRYSSIVIFDI